MQDYQKGLSNFLDKISYQFNDESLLIQALTHPSFSKKNNVASYQRLEFLGDAILAMIMAEILIKKHPKENEGQLSKRQANLVSGEVLSEIAIKIDVGDVLRLSEGEKNIGGKNNKRNLENAVEALIGAIYLDSNINNCRNFILKHWNIFLGKDLLPPKDSVSTLQEITQAKLKQLPKYNIEKTGGSSHNPVFTALLEVGKKKYQSQGSSKKEAQKKVSQLALEDL
jgi:ribonuclease-3